MHALIVNYVAVVEKLRAQQSKPASSSEVSLKTKTSSKTGEKVNIQLKLAPLISTRSFKLAYCNTILSCVNIMMCCLCMFYHNVCSWRFSLSIAIIIVTEE